MSSNSFGTLLKITTFGESHGKAIGVIVDGCPPGLTIDLDLIAKDLARRKPGQSDLTTSRKEDEKFEILSGVVNGKSTGAPIAIQIPNTDAKSADYKHLENTYRPSHADFTYEKKYGNRDFRGGGRSSARETANWVAAGAIAKMILNKIDVRCHAYVKQIGSTVLTEKIDAQKLSNQNENQVRCPHEATAQKMIQEIQAVQQKGDTIGGVIHGVVLNCPIGIGEPIFKKLHASLAKAMLTINAARGFEIGAGFQSAAMLGSEHNDLFKKDGDSIRTSTNNSGGVQGGISNGMPIKFNVAFKPVSTLMKAQETVDDSGSEIILEGKGRHDPCVVPRAVPIVEAMTALVLADYFLLNKAKSQL